MYCKYMASDLAVNRPWMVSSVCEVAGIMIAASAKQLLNYNPINYKFIKENLERALVEAVVKIPASEIKKDIITSSDFNGVYIAAEYAYRVTSNSGKFISFKVVDYVNSYLAFNVIVNNDSVQEEFSIGFKNNCSNEVVEYSIASYLAADSCVHNIIDYYC